jgi:hypothetical protein
LGKCRIRNERRPNAERFNRAIQEEFIEFRKDLLFEDFHAFNDKLLDWLIWFNETRPHYALASRSPMEFLAQEHQGNMYWRDTRGLRLPAPHDTFARTRSRGRGIRTPVLRWATRRLVRLPELWPAFIVITLREAS